MRKLTALFLLILLFSCAPKQENKAGEKASGPEEQAVAADFSGSGLGTMGFEFPVKATEAPSLVLKDLKGKTVKLSDFKGKIVLLNFWATWCGPCRAEMPSMQAFYEKNTKADIVMIAVNIGETEDVVRSYMEENKFTFPVLLDTDQQIALDYDIEAIPTTYIIGKTGQFQARMVSTFEWDSELFSSALESVL